MLTDSIDLFSDIVNNMISAIATALSVIVILEYFVYVLVQNHKKHGAGRGVYLSFLTLLLLLFPLLGFLWLPERLINTVDFRDYRQLRYMELATLRWFVLYAVFCPLVFIVTQKFSGIKCTISMVAHLTVFLLGWLMGKWFGVLFVSLPILALFYFLLYHYAQITFPASNPEDRKEISNKFLALIWYVWGVQYPIWVAPSTTAREFKKAINGDFFKGFGGPGIVWSHSHQIAGLSSGIEFNNVNGPGILFTEQYERPIALVDLRTHLHADSIEVTTKDGVQIKAVLFLSFRIDPDSWDNLNREERHRLFRIAPILNNGFKIDHDNGSYPYSGPRVQATLSSTSIDAPTPAEEKTKVYWDQIVVKRAKREAISALSDRTFKELWIPRKDIRGGSAMSEIAADISEKVRPVLREMGVKLFTARIVNFIFPDGSPIQMQLLESWKSSWEQKIRSKELDGEARAEKLRLDARTAARSAFLMSIVESLNKARSINPDLPKQVVALNFIATLKNLILETDADNQEQQATKLDLLRDLIVREEQK